MDTFLIIFCGVIVLGFLVLIHEGGHYLAARAFGVRVTEFMIGLPGPKIGFKKGETTFGMTAIPLGGYAKVCGMETGKMDPHLKSVLASVYRRGTATMEEVAADCGLSPEEAYEALEELTEWGSVTPPTRKDEHNIYRTPEYLPTKKELVWAHRHCLPAPVKIESGQPRSFESPERLFAHEHAQQYRSLPFWKRSVILLAGIAVNLLFAIGAFVIIYAVIGVDVVNQATGEQRHLYATPLQAIQIGSTLIGMTFQAILGLFNPETAAQTVSDSTSIVGIAVMSKDFLAAGIAEGLYFIAAISISLGLMNLLPIPPLDGGRFLIEIIQKVTKRDVPMKVLGYASMAGMALFLCFFLFMLNQDINRFVFGNW